MADFEWDEDKNRKNKQKHRISFEEATSAFDDPDAIELAARRKGELRIVRIGKTTAKFIVFVVYTLRGLVVRIISARQTNKEERRRYLEKKLNQQGDEDH